MKLWTTATGEARRTLRGALGPVTALAFAPDGRSLAAGGEDGAVRVWQAATGDLRWLSRAHRDAVRGLAFSRDGTVLASAGGHDGTVLFWPAR